MLPTTFTRGIDRALHLLRLGGPYQRRLDRHLIAREENNHRQTMLS